MTIYAAKATPVSAADMSEALRSAWIDKWDNEPTHESICLLMAQWALETARGKYMMNFNVGNRKAMPDQDCTFFTTWELIPRKLGLDYVAKSTSKEPCEIASDDGGTMIKVRFKPNHPVCRFKAYATLKDGCVDYLDGLKSRFAAAWPAVIAGDPTMFCVSLKRSGYFTADLAEYTVAITSLFKEYMKLPWEMEDTDPTVPREREEITMLNLPDEVERKA